MKMAESSAAYFERVAGEWDERRAGYFTEAVREAAIKRAYLRPEFVVADVGAGTGFIAAGLAPHVAKVYVLDGSEAMLAQARRNLAAYDNVVFEVSEGSALPLPDQSVDAAFANMYLHHCPDPAAAIREMARILRPGGRLIITDMDKHDHEWMRTEMADEWLGFERAQVKGWLRDAGLVNVMVECSEQSCCATPEKTGSDADRAEIGVFVAVGTRRVTGTTEAVRASYGAAAERSASCCGDSSASSACCSTESSPGKTAAIALSDTVEYTVDVPLAGNACGCGTSSNSMDAVASADANEMIWDTEYTADDLTGVPAEAAEFSLGCGNPGAIASLRPGEIVLDIGSGGGIDVFHAARRVGPTGRAIGVDMTPQMLERARRTAAKAGITNAEFRAGRADALPAADGSVNVVMSNCVINLTEDKGAVFEEAYRVLAEGGRLAVSDVVASGQLPVSLREDPEAWAGCVRGALPEGEYLALIRAAGFRELRAARSSSRGQIAGVGVYSLSVSAYK
jgi:ubiquinone/menaquinone biosynthesis C-methylase UbiE